MKYIATPSTGTVVTLANSDQGSNGAIAPDAIVEEAPDKAFARTITRGFRSKNPHQKARANELYMYAFTVERVFKTEWESAKFFKTHMADVPKQADIEWISHTQTGGGSLYMKAAIIDVKPILFGGLSNIFRYILTGPSFSSKKL